MKKLITLLLALTGCVCTVSAEWYVKGSWDSWSEAKSLASGSATVDLTSGTTYEFKVFNGSDAYGNNGTMTWNNYDGWEFKTSDGNNCKITPTSTGTYTFTIDTSGSNPKITLTFPSLGTIYFYNVKNWPQPYFYILDANKWQDGNGVSLTGFYNGVAMEQIGTTNIWKADYPINASYVVFLKENQNNYGNIYSTEAVWRTDFSSSSPLFVPSTTISDKKNSTDYYSNGEWHVYPSYTRTVTSGNYGTICLPFAATITGADVFTVASTVGSGDGLTGINLSSVANNETTAGVAYIFQATSTTLTATFSGNYTALAADNGMLGTYTNTTAPEGSYVIGNDNKIHKVISGGTGVNVGKYKGYITLTGIGTASQAPNFIPFFESETTGINAVQREELEVNSYYNLNGQRVANPTKGFYIVNGKKVVTK